MKELFEKEVERIIATDVNPKQIENKLNNAYDLFSRIGELNEDEKESAQILVREILEHFFKGQFNENYSIPISFIDSPVGKVVFSLKFGVPERMYRPFEITAIMDVTRALISHDIKNKKNIKEVRQGKHILIYESVLIEYMKTKGMDMEEVKFRISKYRELKNKGLKTDEIRKEIKESVKNRYIV